MDDTAEIPVIPAISLITRDGTLTKDSVLTNGYFTPLGQEALRIEKRKGVLWTQKSGGAVGNGVYLDALSHYEVRDLEVHQIGISDTHLAPDNIGGTGACYFASTGTLTNPTWVAWHGGNSVVRSHDRNPTHSIISQTIPGVIGSLQAGIAYLDSTFYVVDGSGNVFGSPLGDPSAPWNPLNVIVAQNEADAAVGICRHLNYVVVFGTRTITRFYDAGISPGSPLAQVIGAYRHIGCKDGRSIQAIGDNVFWLGEDQFQFPRVYTFNGTEPQEISTPDVCRALNFTTGVGLIYAELDRAFYMLQTTIGYLVFDTVSRFWSFWTFQKIKATPHTVTLVQNANDPNRYSCTNSFSATSTMLQVNVNSTGNQYVPVQDYSGGLISLRFPQNTYGASVSAVITDYTTFYDIEHASGGLLQAADNSIGVTQVQFTDNEFLDAFAYLAGTTTSPVEFRSRSQDTDAGSRVLKSVSYLDIIGDKSASSIFIRVTDDDYTTYSGWRYTSLVGTPRMWNFGSYKRRAYEVVSLDAAALRVLRIVQKIQG